VDVDACRHTLRFLPLCRAGEPAPDSPQNVRGGFAGDLASHCPRKISTPKRRWEIAKPRYFVMETACTRRRMPVVTTTALHSFQSLPSDVFHGSRQLLPSIA